MAGIENKAESYRKMLAFLEDLGADLGSHLGTHLAKVASTSMGEMDQNDLLHYQRVLEATIDNRSDLMDKTALKEELMTVVSERFARGTIADKNREAREFRGRLARIEAKVHKHAASEDQEHCPICGPNPNHEMSKDRPLSETQYDLTDEEKARDKRNRAPDY